MLLFFISKNADAQQHQVKRTHPISNQQLQLNGSLNATGTLNVVAIMVEFQPDTNRLTTGTGIFGPDGMEGLSFLRNEEDFRIDPLPHDRNYFEAHLDFAKSYYEKASDDQLTIDYRILPDVYRLPKKMEAYSPIGETFTNEKVAELARDAWQKVEEGDHFDTSQLDPENTAFIIFHAGVGRDIELTGTSLDITPFDIPSLYLQKQNFRNLLNDPSFEGFSINDGSFRVTNSMIIPRTETRRGLDIQDNEFAFPLSINGLLVASIGSHLGLPDLFNTETGDPGIGRFGLMDGAGFFAYNGLLPPEPSAWEKVYLGWEIPFEIDRNTEGEINLPAASFDQPNSIAKYELSDSEYFLIENRHRDPEGTGITITIRKPDGSEIQQTFTNRDEEFIYQGAEFDTLLEAGTFVDASNFDFSLPGGLDIGKNENDPGDDRNLNGGILIWHIDEAVIQEKLANARVNADPDRRGIDLEEADGSQDIGKIITGALDNSAAFGTAFDFWWSGNNFRVILQTGREISFYENRFGPDTRPDNKSNSGAPSSFELYDFSGNEPTASFRIRPVEPFSEIYTTGFAVNLEMDGLRNFYTGSDSYYQYYPLSLSMYETQSDTFLIVPSAESTWAVSISEPHTRKFLLTKKPVQQPFVGERLVLAEKPAENKNTVEVAALTWDPASVSFDTVWTSSLPSNNGFISSQNGQVLHADFTDTGSDLSDGSSISLGNFPFQRSEIIGGEFSEASSSGIEFSSLSDFTFNPSSSANRLYTGAIQLGNRNLFYVFEDDRFSAIDPEKNEPAETLFEENEAEWPAILDNGALLRVDKIHNQLIGINRIGGIQNFSPIPAPDGIHFTGTPLYTDLITSGAEYAALVVGQDSLSMNIYAYRNDGTLVEGFPLYVGEASTATTQPIHPIIYEEVLYAVSHRGELKSWDLTQVTNTKWSTRYGNAPFNKVSARVKDQQSGQISTFGVLNEIETYNWPNPANEETNIRFELAAPGGSVDITIISMDGRKIFQRTIQSAGGFPQELNIETRNWGSGGYVARVKATVEGKSETKLIKIGVIH